MKCIALYSWLVMRHFRENWGHHTSFMKQNLCHLCFQPVYRTVSAHIHRHMVGTHALAAYSNVAANTTAVPCTVSAHTPTVLSFISVIFQAHIGASCLRLCWLLAVRKSYDCIKL